MRRIDAIAIGLAVFVVGGVAFWLLQAIGLDSINAGIGSQVLLVGGLLVWVLSYLFRALTQNMTYNQQLKDYEDAVLQKRWEELTPEEREKIQAEIREER